MLLQWGSCIPLCHKPSKASENNHIHKPQPYCPEIMKGVNVHICVLDRYTSKRKLHSSTKQIWKCGYWILATETFDPVEQNTTFFQQIQRNHFHAAGRNPVLCDDDTLRCPPPKSIVILANTPTTNDADFTNKTNMIHSCSEGATNSLKLQSRSKGHASLIANAICQDNNISPF